jgi:hypothetical protein
MLLTDREGQRPGCCKHPTKPQGRNIVNKKSIVPDFGKIRFKGKKKNTRQAMVQVEMKRVKVTEVVEG